MAPAEAGWRALPVSTMLGTKGLLPIPSLGPSLSPTPAWLPGGIWSLWAGGVPAHPCPGLSVAPLSSSMEMCDQRYNITMCPLCDKTCSYWKMSSACATARASHLFDNPATVFFSIFMALWGKRVPAPQVVGAEATGRRGPYFLLGTIHRQRVPGMNTEGGCRKDPPLYLRFPGSLLHRRRRQAILAQPGAPCEKPRRVLCS